MLIKSHNCTLATHRNCQEACSGYTHHRPPPAKGASQPTEGRWANLSQSSEYTLPCSDLIPVSPPHQPVGSLRSGNTKHTHTQLYVFPSKYKQSIWEVIPGNSRGEEVWDSEGREATTKRFMGPVTSVDDGLHVLVLCILSPNIYSDITSNVPRKMK